MNFLLGQRLFNNNIFLYNLNYSASKKQPRKLNKRKLNKKIIKYIKFYPRILNIRKLDTIIINFNQFN